MSLACSCVAAPAPAPAACPARVTPAEAQSQPRTVRSTGALDRNLSTRTQRGAASPAIQRQKLWVVRCAGDAPEAAPAVPSGDSSTPLGGGSKSIFCKDCEGNGAIVCKQCEGGGVNLKDHFEGRFKEGQLCWLCRGKKQILCGNCNGAGFVGGFMSTQDD